MKTRIIFFSMLALFVSTLGYIQGAESNKNTEHSGTFKLYVTPEMHQLGKTWADHYRDGKSNETIDVVVSEISPANQSDAIKSGLWLASEEHLRGQMKAYPWKLELGQEVMVPIMNENNPFAETISKRGISMAQLNAAIEKSGRGSWGDILRNGEETSLPVYVSDNVFVRQILSSLLDRNPDLEMPLIASNELMMRVQHEKNAIGFCSLSELAAYGNQAIPAGVRIIPVDKNGNGKIDYMESIYNDLQSFTRGLWIGKYPGEFRNSIVAVAPEMPSSAPQIDFLKWILTDGQKYLAESGFSEIAYAERLSQLAKFDSPNELASVPVEATSSWLGLFLLIIVLIVATGVVLEIVYARIWKKSGKKMKVNPEAIAPFDLQKLNIPLGYYFDKTYTWVFMRRNGQLKLGINDFMMHLTGPISRIELKRIGDKIKKGDVLFSVISKGRLLNFYSPVSGIIRECNQGVISNPALLKNSPYSEGWIYVVEPLNWSLEMQYLSMGEIYKKWVVKEFTRLIDFITRSVKGHSPEFAHIILQDGGALKDDLLCDLDPKVWEDFQTEFIDTAR